MSTLAQDFRYALRTLTRRPAFAFLAILALALGIGVNSAVFSVVDAVLLRPLPVAEPDRLMKLVRTVVDRGGHYGVSYDDFAAWRDSSRSFESFAAVRSRTFVVLEGGQGERVRGNEVSPSYFATLGVEPAVGRAFSEAERTNGDRVVLVSHGFWQRRLGGDPHVLGRTLVLDREPYTVIGVMPESSEVPYLGWKDLWAPLAEQGRGLGVLARLRDGISEDAAQRDLDAVAARRAEEMPATNKDWGVEMHPVRWWIFALVKTPLLLVYAVSGLVLLIACGTVSNLTFSRVTERRRDIAVRKALGAPRGVLLRQLLAESVVLALAGGMLGLVLARAGISLLPSLVPDVPRIGDVTVDLRGLAVMLAASIAVGVASGLAPSLALLRTSSLALREGSRGSGGHGGRHIRQLLVAAETALALLAVVGAGLLVRSLGELREVDPGFDADHLLTMRLDLPVDRLESEAARIAAMRQLLGRVEALPGVVRAGAAAFDVPMKSGWSTFELYLEGRPMGPRPDVIVSAQFVSGGYLEALGIELLAGRDFEPGETWETAHAVLVNQTLARRYWPDRDPIGRWVGWQNGDRGTVVGVVGDVRQQALHHSPAAEVYVAWGSAPASQSLAVKTALTDPRGLVTRIRGEINTWLPGVPVYEVATGRELIRESYADRRLWTVMMSLFASLALGLGFLGFYGVVAHWVAGRRREIGIRMALGAWPAAIVRLVVGQGLRSVLAGLGAGVGLALGLTRLLESQLYGVTARDPLTFLLGAGLVVLTGVAVCAVPARRAGRVEPGTAIRSE